MSKKCFFLVSNQRARARLLEETETQWKQILNSFTDKDGKDFMLTERKERQVSLQKNFLRSYFYRTSDATGRDVLRLQQGQETVNIYIGAMPESW